jgi:peroxiredoxin
LSNQLRDKKIEDIYCISVNDAFVMKAWLDLYSKANSIKGIADGNAEFAKEMNLLDDYSGNFMGNRCRRFALVADNNVVSSFNIEKKGQYFVSSAEHILELL